MSPSTTRRLLVLALWCSLLVASVGVALWACSVGAGLVAAGLSTAALLLFVVDPDRADQTDKRTEA